MSTVVVGEIYTGEVLKIKPFGAVVSMPQGNPPGLVHISQITNGFVQDINEVLAIGDEVNVRVITNDIAAGKISLSMKDVPQAYDASDEYDDNEDDDSYTYTPQPISAAAAASFEEKFKAWQKTSNERIAGINRRNKRR